MLIKCRRIDTWSTLGDVCFLQRNVRIIQKSDMSFRRKIRRSPTRSRFRWSVGYGTEGSVRAVVNGVRLALSWSCWGRWIQLKIDRLYNFLYSVNFRDFNSFFITKSNQTRLQRLWILMHSRLLWYWDCGFLLWIFITGMNKKWRSVKFVITEFEVKPWSVSNIPFFHNLCMFKQQSKIRFNLEITCFQIHHQFWRRWWEPVRIIQISQNLFCRRNLWWSHDLDDALTSDILLDKGHEFSHTENIYNIFFYFLSLIHTRHFGTQYFDKKILW